MQLSAVIFVLLAIFAASAVAWGDESLVFANGAQANFPREDCSCICQCSKSKIGATEALASFLNEQEMPLVTEVQA
jgi:hypothetical protein